MSLHHVPLTAATGPSALASTTRRTPSAALGLRRQSRRHPEVGNFGAGRTASSTISSSTSSCGCSPSPGRASTRIAATCAGSCRPERIFPLQPGRAWTIMGADGLSIDDREPPAGHRPGRHLVQTRSRTTSAGSDLVPSLQRDAPACSPSGRRRAPAGTTGGQEQRREPQAPRSAGQPLHVRLSVRRHVLDRQRRGPER